MKTYEAQLSVTIEYKAADPENADRLALGEFTNRLLETASRDEVFKLWSEVTEIEEVAD